MRYFGQNYHREVVFASNAPIDQPDFDAAIEAFNADYKSFYGYDTLGELVEVVGLVVTASGARQGPAAQLMSRTAEPAEETTRDVYFAGEGFQETTVLQRASLPVGEVRQGPAIVEEALSTTLVPPGARLRVHESGSLIITGNTGEMS